MITNFEQIEKIKDLGAEVVHVDAWDDDVTIRRMTGEEGDDFTQRSMKAIENKDLMKGFRCDLIAATLIDQNGNLIISKKQVSELNKKSSQAIEQIFKACMKINGLSAESKEENEKN